MLSNRFRVKSEFEIASEYYPPNFKSGAFFDDEIEAVNEGRVEPIEDAWYRPFTSKKCGKFPEIENSVKMEEETKIYDFSKNFDEIEENPYFNQPSNEEYEKNVIILTWFLIPKFLTFLQNLQIRIIIQKMTKLLSKNLQNQSLSSLIY